MIYGRMREELCLTMARLRPRARTSSLPRRENSNDISLKFDFIQTTPEEFAPECDGIRRSDI